MILSNLNAQNNQQIVTDMYYESHGKSIVFDRVKEVRNSLKLDTLENGYDSIQLRLWLTPSRSDEFQVFCLKRKNHIWSSVCYDVSAFFNKNRDSILFYKKEAHQLAPKSSWETIFKKLVKLNVLTLPDFRKLKKYPKPFDGGNSITIEIATIKWYKIYMFQEPNYNKKKFKEAQDLDNILKLISYEFNLQLIDKF